MTETVTLQTKTQDMLMCDYHGTFIFSSGGTITEKEWSFSAIDIKKATLKLKIENAPSSLLFRSGMAVDYYDAATLSWKELGSVEVYRPSPWWGGEASKEVDVTSICKANPKFKWRIRVWVPFQFFYSCMKILAVLHLEYAMAEPEGIGVQSTKPFGDLALAPLAQGFELMMNVMMMFMMMSLMVSMVSAMAGMLGGS